MSYIGTGPLYGNYVTEQLSPSPNGVLVSWPLSSTPVNAQSLIVCIDGVKQNASSAYTLSGVTLTFTAPPALGTEIEVMILGLQADSIVVDQTLGSVAKMRINSNTITESFAIGATENAVSGGPIEIAGSNTITVNGNWSVV